MDIQGQVFCLFEQSGTFRDQFTNLGIMAADYDIRNDYGCTDHHCDLFTEISRGFAGSASLFDCVSQDDLLFAFFPCTYFCENNKLYFEGTHNNLSRLSVVDRNLEIMRRAHLRNDYYILILKLFTICDVRKIRLIVEQPYTQPHFLTHNFPYKPSIIDRNRTVRGDYFVKPTQYFFLNCQPTYGESFCTPKERKRIISTAKSDEAGMCSPERSLISPVYARNFICDFILGKPQPTSTPQLLFTPTE